MVAMLLLLNAQTSLAWLRVRSHPLMFKARQPMFCLALINGPPKHVSCSRVDFRRLLQICNQATTPRSYMV